MSSHHLPLILLCGKAGTGKDTIGSYVAATYNGVCVGLADPMKRFVHDVFGFTEHQLWGPSEARNEVDQRTVDERLAISKAFGTFAQEHRELLGRVVPKDTRNPYRPLERWFEVLYATLESGIPVSPRLALQTLGTEYGRAISKDMWSQYSIEVGKRLVGGGHTYTRAGGVVEDKGFAGYDFVVVTDGRFRNEVVNHRAVGGVALLVERDTDNQGIEQAGVREHVSERELNGIPDHFFSERVSNNGSIYALTERVSGLIRYFYGV